MTDYERAWRAINAITFDKTKSIEDRKTLLTGLLDEIAISLKGLEYHEEMFK